jgi:predicted nuclease of restriction endonuclease-like (RecB) superfamily
MAKDSQKPTYIIMLASFKCGQHFPRAEWKIYGRRSDEHFPRDEWKIYERDRGYRLRQPIRLSWTHYRVILQVEDTEARSWYEHEAATEMWSTRTLQRNVSSQYYYRLLKSQNKPSVKHEMVELTKPLQDKLEYLKNPVIAEFLGFKNNTDYTESNLEQSIIDHLIPFLMELGRVLLLLIDKSISTQRRRITTSTSSSTTSTSAVLSSLT